MKYIVVFEDDKAKRIDLVRKIKQKVSKQVSVIPINGEGEQDSGSTYEKQINEILIKYAIGRALIVCDKDLTGMGKRFIGLSATPVSEVADLLGLPICLYARGEGRPTGEGFLLDLRPWEKKRIILEYSDEETLAKQCVYIFNGFKNVSTAYKKLHYKYRSTPAKALSMILGRLDLEDRISLYGSGEQDFLSDIMPFIKEGDTIKTKKDLANRMPRVLGNWLYTSILRFPGILTNRTATASYLNIHPDDFRKPKIQELFSRAKYRGPFSEYGEWWWRSDLESVIINNKCEDGLSLVKKKKLTSRPCKDKQTGEKAGYFCMVTEEPVSKNNSRGGISWFPSGADLARIRKDKFDEIGPWVGLY